MSKQRKLTEEEIDLLLNAEKYGWGGALSGGLSGAASGASIGTIGGPWGIAAGAVVGGAIGAFTGDQKEVEQKAADNLRKTQAQSAARNQEYMLSNDGTQSWNAPVFALGGQVNQYQGQTHQGPNGGIPVDKDGNPSIMTKQRPVGLTEKGEVSYGGYIFSAKLKNKKGNTFASIAKRILSHYKTRLGKKYDGGDKLAQEALKRELDVVKNSNERERIKAQYSRDNLKSVVNSIGLPKHHDGGDITDPYFKPWDGVAGLVSDNLKTTAGQIPLVRNAEAIYKYFDNNNVVGSNKKPDPNINNWGGWDTFKTQVENSTKDQLANTAKIAADVYRKESPNIAPIPKTTISDKSGGFNFMDAVNSDRSNDLRFVANSGRPGDISPIQSRGVYDIGPADLKTTAPDNTVPPESKDKPKTQGVNSSAISAGIAGLGALSNIVRGIAEKPQTYNPENYTIHKKYNPILMRADEVNNNARESYANRLRIARNMSPTQAALFMRGSEAASQNQMAGIKERIFNTNAQQLNKAQVINEQIANKNNATRMSINQINDANEAAKENLISSGISQLGQIAQGYTHDQNAKTNYDKMITASDAQTANYKNLLDKIYSNAGKTITTPEQQGQAIMQDNGTGEPTTGNSFNYNSYKKWEYGRESSNNPNAKNPNSSSGGLGQFTNTTWLSEYRKLHPETKLNDGEILKLKADTQTMDEVNKSFTIGNVERIKKAGLEPDNTSVYALHFFGPSGGVKVLKSEPTTLISDIVSPATMKANSFLEGMTVADWKAKIKKEMGGK